MNHLIPTLIVALLAGGLAVAEDVTLVPAEAVWEYQVLDFDLFDNWASLTYDSFPWDTATWSTGSAGFSDAPGLGLPVQTLWEGATDLALRRHFDLDYLPTRATLSLAVDNGAVVFINGQLFRRVNAEGWTWRWEYQWDVPADFFVLGSNTISVLAEDHGRPAYFDLQLTAAPKPDDTIYVDDTALGLNNGTSWADAYLFLQDALAEAAARGAPVTIKVAQGVYRPDRTTVAYQGTGDRAATFELPDGAVTLGGYAGSSGTDPDARDVLLYETILSGDLLGDDSGDPAAFSDNSLHVVTAAETSAATLLDGLTITGGNADANKPDHTGGGLLQQGGELTVRDCTFVANMARWTGGGAVCRHGTVTFGGCTFVDNTAAHGAGLYYLGFGDAAIEDCLFTANEAIYEGGALALDTGSVQVTACTFQNNVAGWSGGAIFVHPGDRAHTITDCRFIGNTAMGQALNAGGGAIGDRGPATTVSGCLFQGNRAFGDIDELAGLGGAVYCDGANTDLVNCTFADNYANVGNALACDEYVQAGNATATNCIFWDGGSELWTGPESVLAVSYSNLRPDAQSDTADDYIDPLFASPGCWADPSDPNLLLGPQDPGALWMPGDYHLMSRQGRWDPMQETWVADTVTSPCIDAGDPGSPWSDEPQPNGGRINLGAYGGTPEASMSPPRCVLSVSSAGSGAVAVPGEGDFAYECGDQAAVGAVAQPCHHFVRWTGTAVDADRVADANDPETIVTVDADYTLVANFEVDQVELVLSSGEGGSVKTPGEGTYAYDCGTCVPVEAAADACHAFSHWTGTAVEQGNVSDPNDPNTVVCLDADCTLEAQFLQLDRVLTVTSGPHGSVVTPGEGPFTCACGAQIDILAVADEHCFFTAWSGTAVEAGKVDDPADPNTTVIVDGDYTLQANFAVEQHTLTVTSGQGGWLYVVATGDGFTRQGFSNRTFRLDHGTTVLLEAIPAPGYVFHHMAGQSGAFYGTTPCWELYLEEDWTLTATFVAEPTP